MTIAVFDEVRKVPYSRVRCSADGELELIELLGAQVVSDGLPNVLIARLRGDDVVEAHAFAPEVSFAGHDYDMVQLIAADVDGTKKPDCRVARSEGTTLICNDMTMMPWLGNGPTPNPSLKVSYSCGE